MRRLRPLLGEMLLTQGLVSEAELASALEQQQATGQPLGDILVEMGLVSPPVLADVLLLQQSWKPLGRLLVEKGLVTDDELAKALSVQERTGRPLGEIIRTSFAIPAEALGELLAEQYRLQIEIETGFGTGLRNEIDERHRARTARPEMPGRVRKSAEAAGLAGRMRDVEALRATLADQTEAIGLLNAAHRARTQEIEGLRDGIADRDRRLHELRERLDGHRGASRD